MAMRSMQGLLLSICLTQGAWADGWSAGVAKINVTPKESMWMAGYAARDRPSEGKLTDLWAKGLVLDDGQGSRAVLITADLIGMDRKLSRAVREAIADELGLPLRSVALNFSHTHSGPVVGNVLAPQQRLDRQQRDAVDRYASNLQDRLLTVARDASRQLAPCRLSWGVGECDFAVNRRENKSEDVPRLKAEGRLKGPVDHSVPVLRVADASGRMAAVVFGYACHATVTNFFEWSGDYPGFAQMALEEEYPGAIAMFWAGCGADQNPLPRRTIELARSYGRQLAGAVEDVLETDTAPILGRMASAYEEIPLRYGEGPSYDEIRAKLNSRVPKEANWARLMLARRESGDPPEDYPYPIQLWRLGDGPMLVLLGGEVVVDYSLRLKAESGVSQTWVAGYSNDVMNYIPSRRVLDEGGYEGLTGMYTYGRPAPWAADVEERIVAAIHRIAKQLEDGSVTTAPNPGERVAAIQDQSERSAGHLPSNPSSGVSPVAGGKARADDSPTGEMARFERVAAMIGQKMRPLAGREQMPLEHHIRKLDQGEMSYGSCGMNQQVTAYYLNREGIKCRRIGLTGEANHTVCEVWLDGRWQFFDGLDGVFIPMSLEDMLASDKDWPIRDFGGGRYKKRYTGVYREYIEHCCTKKITYNPRKRNERIVVTP